MEADVSGSAVNWHVIPDPGQLINDASALILRLAERAIAERGVFRFVLAGGRTPERVYRKLAGSDADWQHWQVYFGDERCLPASDPGRNSVMATASWLGQVPVAPENIHVIPAERGADDAARAYSGVIDAARPFDLVMLGMGEDGHTASLFPGGIPCGGGSVVAIHDAPKPPAERVSLGLEALCDTARVLVLVTGVGKHAALLQWKRGDELPIARVRGRQGMDVFLDQAAAIGE